tara:strand:+ start:2922 stop:3182 length:261 start_codon:yes stop_codon:yes gene_type:complete
MDENKFVKLIGDNPSADEYSMMTQHFIKAYHRYGVDPTELVGVYGIELCQTLLEHNELEEEYELCSIFKNLINDYKKTIENEKSNI